MSTSPGRSWTKHITCPGPTTQILPRDLGMRLRAVHSGGGCTHGASPGACLLAEKDADVCEERMELLCRKAEGIKNGCSSALSELCWASFP